MYLLNNLRVQHTNPVKIYCDNQSVIHIANNPMFHKRTKHIQMDCHVANDKIQAQIIHLMPIQSIQ